VDCVFLGSAAGCSHSNNPARWAMLDAGLGYETSASYVEMQCGSGIDSINHAAWKILANHADIVIAGGMGPRAVELFRQNGIDVVLGAQESDPEQAVLSHLNGVLSTGDNVCDHG